MAFFGFVFELLAAAFYALISIATAIIAALARPKNAVAETTRTNTATIADNKTIATAEKTEHKRQQAREDLDFFAAERDALIELALLAEEEYNNAATNKQKMSTGNRLTAYNERLRRLDKRIEDAHYTAHARHR